MIFNSGAWAFCKILICAMFVSEIRSSVCTENACQGAVLYILRYRMNRRLADPSIARQLKPTGTPNLPPGTPSTGSIIGFQWTEVRTKLAIVSQDCTCGEWLRKPTPVLRANAQYIVNFCTTKDITLLMLAQYWIQGVSYF